MRLTIAISFLFLTATLSFAGAADYTDEVISGRVLEVLNHKGEITANIATQAGNIWIRPSNGKLVKGKKYEFYPPYSVSTEYKQKNNQKISYKIFYTVGPIDRNIDHEKFSFKGIKIGMPMNDVGEMLKKMGFDYETEKSDDIYKMSTITVKGFELGTETYYVGFKSDIFQKLVSFEFRKSSYISEKSAEWVEEHINYLNKMLTVKYGKPMRCHNKSYETVLYESRADFCSWRFGDYSIFTTYSYDNGIGTVKACVISLTKTLQSYNRLTAEIRECDETIQELNERVEKINVEKGASSF